MIDADYLTSIRERASAGDAAEAAVSLAREQASRRLAVLWNIDNSCREEFERAVRELETNYGDALDAMRPLDANAMRLYAHARGSFTQ
jgi:hypothetical protein